MRGHCVNGKTLFGYIYAYTYAEVKQALTLAKASTKQAAPVRSIGNGTLGGFLLWWLKNVMRERVKVSTYAQYQERIFHHIIPALGGIAVYKLSKEQVQGFVNALLNLKTITCLYPRVLELGREWAGNFIKRVDRRYSDFPKTFQYHALLFS